MCWGLLASALGCPGPCAHTFFPSLSLAGIIFAPGRFARDASLSHPPHVMSDHILLGAAVHAGLAAEAALGALQAGRAGASGEGTKRAS